MPERSKRILYDEKKLELINLETKKLMQKYTIDMSLRELSPKTIYQYQKDLEQWFVYILDNQENKCVTELSDDDITEFFYFCKMQGNNTERMKRRMAAASAFYKFLRKKKLIVENPMEFMDRPKKGQPVNVQTFLTKEQVELLKAKLIEYGNLQIRTYILFSLSTMARVNAVSSIRWEQIDFDERVVHDVLEKEGKIVDLFFSEEVKGLLLDLKADRETKGINDNGWVFYSNKTTPTQPISVGTLNDWCKIAGELINVPTLHPHDLRHSSSNIAFHSGMPLEVVSALLHHSGTDVTRQRYLKEDKTKLIKMKDQFNI